MKTQQKPALVKRELYVAEYKTKKKSKPTVTIHDALFIVGMVAFVTCLILMGAIVSVGGV